MAATLTNCRLCGLRIGFTHKRVAGKIILVHKELQGIFVVFRGYNSYLEVQL